MPCFVWSITVDTFDGFGGAFGGSVVAPTFPAFLLLLAVGCPVPILVAFVALRNVEVGCIPFGFEDLFFDSKAVLDALVCCFCILCKHDYRLVSSGPVPFPCFAEGLDMCDGDFAAGILRFPLVFDVVGVGSGVEVDRMGRYTMNDNPVLWLVGCHTGELLVPVDIRFFDCFGSFFGFCSHADYFPSEFVDALDLGFSWEGGAVDGFLEAAGDVFVGHGFD
jgi:hypothetical protein